METKYKIFPKFFSPGYHAGVYYINLLLIFLSLRRKRKYWGVVYDAVSKQPLDPAIVKLLYADERDALTCVTDLAGRYGFLAHPGKFKLFVKKTNYTFPSQLVRGDSDGAYDNIYHGEFFELFDDYEFIAPNIPMDPVGADWNQAAKLGVYKTHPYRDYFIRWLAAIYFWFIFIMSVIALWAHAGTGGQATGIILSGYAVLFLLALVTPKARLWGKIKQSLFSTDEILLELQNSIAPGVVFGKTTLLPDGRFFLRANPGPYILCIKHRISPAQFEELGKLPVHVGGEGTLNVSFKIRK